MEANNVDKTDDSQNAEASKKVLDPASGHNYGTRQSARLAKPRVGNLVKGKKGAKAVQLDGPREREREGELEGVVEGEDEGEDGGRSGGVQGEKRRLPVRRRGAVDWSDWPFGSPGEKTKGRKKRKKGKTVGKKGVEKRPLKDQDKEPKSASKSPEDPNKETMITDPVQAAPESVPAGDAVRLVRPTRAVKKSAKVREMEGANKGEKVEENKGDGEGSGEVVGEIPLLRIGLKKAEVLSDWFQMTGKKSLGRGKKTRAQKEFALAWRLEMKGWNRYEEE